MDITSGHENLEHTQGSDSDVPIKRKCKKRKRINYINDSTSSEDDTKTHKKFDTLAKSAAVGKSPGKPPIDDSMKEYTPPEFDITPRNVPNHTAAASTSHVSTGNGESNNRGHNQLRKLRCLKCSYYDCSLKKLNDHYKDSHEQLKCPKCGKPFSMPSGLAKHSNTHQDNIHCCSKCDPSYPILLSHTTRTQECIGVQPPTVANHLNVKVI